MLSLKFTRLRRGGPRSEPERGEQKLRPPSLRTTQRTPALVLLAAVAAVAVPPACAGIGPSVQEVIEFTRIIQPVRLDSETLQTQRSPDGLQLFIVTRQADVATDTNRFDVLVMDVSPRQLSTGTSTSPRRVLSVLARRDNNDAFPAVANVRWAGDRTLVLRARINDEPYQAYKLDVPTQQLTQLSFAPTGVVSFDASQDLQRLVYLSPVPNPPAPAGSRSVVAGTISFWSLHFGQDDYATQQRRYQFYTVQAGARGQELTLGDAFPESNLTTPEASISPDGRWALLPKFEPERQQAWSRQYTYVAQLSAAQGAALVMDPLSYFTRPSSYVTRRVVAYRLADRQPHDIVDAPDDARAQTQKRAPGVWMNAGRSVIIAGTFLPRREGRDGGDGGDQRSHIIEYWPDSGRWRDVATLSTRAVSARAAPILEGAGEAFVVMDGDQPRTFVRAQGDEHWQERQAPAAGVQREVQREVDATKTPGSWGIQVDQALNQPPDIWARGPDGQAVRLTDLNPQYAQASWGTMRAFNWKDAAGRAWHGGLMVPADFSARQRYPLVIQSYGFSPSRFYRDGSNIYDGYTSGFAGRAFLREGILVLAMPLGPVGGSPEGGRAYRQSFVHGVRGAIDALVAQGLVDRDRIGLMGWSATGESVLNLVTFSDVPIRAASLLDGDANTLFSLTITNAATDTLLMKKEHANLGGPYGASRQNWLANDPSLHTECIRAAMRIETYGAEVHNNWDIYALLRRQYKPAEMIMFPAGAHALSRPSERMISMQGNVDWYRFWLKGEKRSEPLVPGETAESLSQQYARWDQMLTLKQRGDATPVCTDDRLQ